MKINGECHCRAIAYEAVVDPQKASFCNCADCQTLSGAPFRANVPTADFVILKGQPKIYVKIAASGNRRAQGFCGECGTPIYASDAENPTQFNLRLGAVKERAEITPLKQIWCNSALSWAQNVSGVPGFAKG